MRRREREVTHPDRIDAVIQSCDCCRIALCGGEEAPYIVPLSFGWERTPEGVLLYFHGSGKGRKMELIGCSPRTGFEMDTAHQIVGGGAACSYSTHYRSVIGTGRIERVTRYADKLHALDRIMEHYEPGKSWTYEEKTVRATEVLRMMVKELSCKAFEPEQRGGEHMGELKDIMEKFAASGWDLIAGPAQDWLDGNGSREALIRAVEQADRECGSCGCELDPLYKRALELLSQ